MNAPAARIAGEESFEIAGDAVVIAEQQPGDVVDDVMQAGDDEHTIEHAVGKEPVLAGAEHLPGSPHPCRAPAFASRSRTRTQRPSRRSH
jgi:hypothetical protein